MDIQESSMRKQAEILLMRLERLSADSIWAHRASGIRGAIIRLLENQNILDIKAKENELKNLLEIGFEILIHAAGEIPDHNE